MIFKYQLYYPLGATVLMVSHGLSIADKGSHGMMAKLSVPTT